MKNNKNKTLIIIPTYNEIMNIKQLIPAVLDMDENIEILFIDDNSPDGTATAIKKIMKKEPRIAILERERKLGLGTAYITGFKYAIENKYKYVFEMDADFSHNPAYLPEMIKTLNKGADVVVGSRYIHGVSVAHWPLKRLLLSKFANVYASFMTGIKIKDLTAGFVGYKRKVLETIDFHYIHSSGYSFQIEMKHRCSLWGFDIREIPIIFTDRTKGESKISRRIVYEALFRCLTLRFSRKPERLKIKLKDKKAAAKKK